jgi:hypothetical protein
MKEIYVITDIEADGPCPGINSMLSFGSIAVDETGKELGIFSANLNLLEGAVPDPDTMDFWAKNPEAWKASRVNSINPAVAMNSYTHWISELKQYGKPIFCGEPAGFDFTFVYWYLLRFGCGKPFSHSALDIKTLAMAALKCNYSSAVKRNFPKEWFNPAAKHTHNALDDAREQAYIFIQILKRIKG